MKVIIFISWLLFLTREASFADDEFEYGHNDVSSDWILKPKLTPRTDICHMRKDLFDNEKYLKSLCMVYGLYTYEESRRICAENNMNLFIIDDAIVETHFFDATTYLIRGHPGGVVWINGKRSSDYGQWNVFNFDQSKRGLLFNELIWADKHNSGECLKFSSASGPYRALPASCNDKHWGVCEHFKRTEYPASLDVAPCRNKKDLYVDGEYVKSMCIIQTTDTYDEGRQRCARHGMNLFILENAKVEEAFHQATNHFLSPFPTGAVWINGMRDKNTNKWTVYNTNRTPRDQLFSGVIWGTNGETSGNCLRYTRQNRGPYRSIGFSCESRHWVICEYDS